VANNLESESSGEEKKTSEGTSGWVRIALITAASAVAGGLATAWFYRKTLARLRETGENPQNPHFGIPDEGQADDPADEI
jgi:flagellar basal body-associated protein FliL